MVYIYIYNQVLIFKTIKIKIKLKKNTVDLINNF